MKEDDLKVCGNCCWFKHEDTDGFGVCYQRYPDHIPYRGDDPCDKYISNKENRKRCGKRRIISKTIGVCKLIPNFASGSFRLCQLYQENVNHVRKVSTPPV